MLGLVEAAELQRVLGKQQELSRHHSPKRSRILKTPIARPVAWSIPAIRPEHICKHASCSSCPRLHLARPTKLHISVGCSPAFVLLLVAVSQNCSAYAPKPCTDSNPSCWTPRQETNLIALAAFRWPSFPTLGRLFEWSARTCVSVRQRYHHPLTETRQSVIFEGYILNLHTLIVDIQCVSRADGAPTTRTDSGHNRTNWTMRDISPTK